MKKDFIEKLRNYKGRLVELKRDIGKLPTERVSQIKHRTVAEELANVWVEELRSPLEHKFKIDKVQIEAVSQLVKRLHVLSRPNNQKSSYIDCLGAILRDFDDVFILPIQQSAEEVSEILDLRKLLPGLTDVDENEYLKEAISCAEANHYKAAIVMGWCAAVDRMQSKVMAVGFQAFNTASKAIKAQTSGKYKRWSKEFTIASLSELQAVFDTDLIIVLEGMNLFDGNESQRLETCFQYRNHSAHPGDAPIEPAHVVSFFTDIVKIVLVNPKFSIP